MKDKIKAALTHLILSAFVILGSTGFILLYFYPGMFAEMLDVTDLLKILVPVDIVIGPLLTFLLYKKGKKGLKLDLTLIICCQLAALAYGNWSAYISRPGFLVFYHDAFFIAPPGIPQEKILPDLHVGPLSQPRMVYFNLDVPLDQKMKLVGTSMEKGIPVHFTSEYFEPLEQIDNQTLTQYSRPLERVRQRNMSEKTHQKLEALAASGKNLAYLPLIYADSTKMLVIDVDGKSVIATLEKIIPEDQQP